MRATLPREDVKVFRCDTPMKGGVIRFVIGASSKNGAKAVARKIIRETHGNNVSTVAMRVTELRK